MNTSGEMYVYTQDNMAGLNLAYINQNLRFMINKFN